MRRPHDLMDRVAAVLQEVSALGIEPRFAALGKGEVEDKSPGELVTVADREAEALLTAALEAILPGVVVVGEEAASANPWLLDALRGEQAWLVDPLDGTANFVDGSADWSVMVALMAAGTTVASWIWQPARRRMYVAERGRGAASNGIVVRCGTRPTDAGRLRGAVLPRFLDAATAAAVARNRSTFADVSSGRRWRVKSPNRYRRHACPGCGNVAGSDLDWQFWRTKALGGDRQGREHR